MEQPKFSINDILRYLSIGIIFIALIIVNERPSLIYKESLSFKEYGWLLSGILTFTIGSLLYLLYRNLIYPAIFRIQDRFRSPGNPNYRIYFRKLFKCSTNEAMLFWVYVRIDSDITEKVKSFDRESSGIHLLYMTSILFLIFSFPFARGLEIPFWIFPSGAVLFFIAAFRYDRNIETLEYLQIKNIPPEQLAKCWKAFKN